MKDCINYFLSIFLLFSALNTFAQNSMGIAIMKFVSSESNGCSIDNVNSFAADASSVLSSDRRFLIIKPEAYQSIIDELDRQKDPGFLKSRNVADQLVAVGAKYILFMDLVNCSISEKTNSDGKVTYSATVEIEVSKINVSSTISEFSEKISGSSLPLVPYSTPSAAAQAAVSSVGKKVKAVLVRAFPVESKIIKITPNKKGTAIESAVISGGEGSGVSKGMLFEVIVLDILNGETFEQPIGTLKITEMNGTSFSTGEPTKGAKEIFDAFNKDASKIILRASGSRNEIIDIIPKIN
jgi:hypothetical protein